MRVLRRALAPLGFIIGPPAFGLLYVWLRLRAGHRQLTFEPSDPPYMLVPNARGLFATAMTFPVRIFHRGPTISTELLKHERVHTKQWKQYGLLGFPARYMYEFIARGRAENLLEIEARIAAPGTY